jgi:CRP-like cAMP-binding protein
VTKARKKKSFKAESLLDIPGEGRSVSHYRKNETVYVQEDQADSIFYIQKGRVKICVVSEHGKEAVIALNGNGDFFGEGCLSGKPLRTASAITITECVITQIKKTIVLRALRDEPDFSEIFIAHLLARNSRLEEDLVDQLFNSSEKRLARVLLLMADFGKEGNSELVIPKISQETLAEMVGTTRARINSFMNKFRKLGFIHYSNGVYNDGIHVHSSLLDVVLHDRSVLKR